MLSAHDKAILYRITSNKWIKLADVPRHTFLGAASASKEHGCVYISGGCLNVKLATSSVYAYDTKAKLWLSRPSMTHARLVHSMEAYGEKLYVLGGITRH